MSDKTDKKRPIEERIAALMGRSGFVDFREGFGGTRGAAYSDQDIAAALGAVSEQHGRLAPLVLETYFGSTMIHAPTLRRAWEDQERKKDDTRERIVLTRFAGELAIRQLGGAKHCSTQYAEYAYLIFSRREALQQRVKDAGTWLEDIRVTALHEFKRQLREEIHALRAKMAHDKAAKRAGQRREAA